MTNTHKHKCGYICNEYTGTPVVTSCMLANLSLAVLYLHPQNASEPSVRAQRATGALQSLSWILLTPISLYTCFKM